MKIPALVTVIPDINAFSLFASIRHLTVDYTESEILQPLKSKKNKIIVNQNGCAILLLIIFQKLFQNFEKAIYKFFKVRKINLIFTFSSD